MQELKHIRGGATVVISVDGLNWLSKRKGTNKGIRKRDEELHFWLSSGQMIQDDEEEGLPVTCFCFLDQRGSSTHKAWRSTDCRSGLVTGSVSFSLCRQQRWTQQPAFVPLDLFDTAFSKEATWTRLSLNVREIFGLIPKNLDMANHQDPHNRFIMFSDDCIPSQLCSDVYSPQNCITFIKNSDCLINHNNNMTAAQSSTAQWSFCPNAISENDQSTKTDRDNLNTAKRRSLSASNQKYNHTGDSSGQEEKVKIRKSVSFDDDVMVYLFDQESSTLQMHSEPHTSLISSYSCNLPGVTLEDNALEWEDDFSALEQTECHFQYDGRSHPYSLSLQTHNRTAQSRPESGCLPQNCLFLTYVTESDLE